MNAKRRIIQIQGKGKHNGKPKGGKEYTMAFADFITMVLDMNNEILSWNHPMATRIWKEEGYDASRFNGYTWAEAYEHITDYYILFMNLAELADKVVDVEDIA